MVPATLESIGMLICVTPMVSTGGTSIVEIKTNGALLVSKMTFEFHAPATINSIFPLVGPASGGSTVTLQGENFQPTGHALCLFTGSVQHGVIPQCVAVAVQYLTHNSITCTSPV